MIAEDGRVLRKPRRKSTKTKTPQQMAEGLIYKCSNSMWKPTIVIKLEGLTIGDQYLVKIINIKDIEDGTAESNTMLRLNTSLFTKHRLGEEVRAMASVGACREGAG